MSDVRIDTIPVNEYMSEDIITGSPNDTLSDALSKMRKNNISELPIVEKNRLVGLVSYAVLTRRRRLPLTTLVENVMFSPPRISPETPLTKSAELIMLNDYQAVPVTDREKLVGLVTRQAILRFVREVPEFVGQPLTSVMSPLTLYVNEDDAASKALHRMKELDEQSIPVLDESEMLVGVLTLKEVTRMLEEPREKASRGELSGEKKSPNIEVKGLMSTPPISVQHDTSLIEVIDLMLEHDLSMLPVLEGRKIAGVISTTDLIELLARYQEREQCFVEIAGLDIEDPSIYDAMYTIIQKYLKKINNLFKPQTLRIHVEHHHHEFDLYKYTLRGRLNTKKKLYTTKSFDWDIIKATDVMMEHFEKQIRKDHEKWHDLSRLRGL